MILALLIKMYVASYSLVKAFSCPSVCVYVCVCEPQKKQINVRESD